MIAQYNTCLFTHDLSGGGVEKMRLRLAEAMRQDGWNPTLVLQEDAGDTDPTVFAGLRIVFLGRRRMAGSVPRLLHVVRRRRAPVLISSLHHANLAAFAVRLLAGRALSLLICQHNALSRELALGWRYRLMPLLYRLLGWLADGVICVSSGVAADFAQVTGLRRPGATVIYNPVADPAPEGGPLSAAAPHPWFGEAAPVFVWAGRLVAQKDPHTALAAFAARRRQGPARLVMLGDGELAPGLRAEARALGVAQDVLFAGYVADPGAWMERAEAVLCTSRYEGFGNVIVEALARGTPVVATDCAYGPAEILQHGKFGVLAACGDAAGLAAALARDLRAEFAPALLRARAACFGLPACLEAHRALIDSVARGRKQGFGLSFSRRNAGGVAALCREMAAGAPSLVVTPNSEHVALLRQARFAHAYRQARIVTPDGAPVAFYAWLRGASGPRRVTGCAVVRALLRHPALAGRRVALVAESAATSREFAAWWAERFDPRDVTLCVAPPALRQDPAGARRLAESLRQAAPDLVLMTLGAPASEIFVAENRAALPDAWFLCVGQAVRVELGLVHRAPAVLRGFGLEWAWRLAQEPRRLGPRYVRAALNLPRAIARDLWQES